MPIQIQMSNFKSISKVTTKKSPEFFLAKGNNSCKSWSNFICTTSRQIHKPNVKSISQKTAEKSPEM